MKNSKKAILGFLIATLFSLAILQGMSIKNERHDITLISWGAGAVASYASSEGQHGLASAWNVTAGVAFTAAGSLAVTTGWSGIGLVGAGVLTL